MFILQTTLIKWLVPCGFSRLSDQPSNSGKHWQILQHLSLCRFSPGMCFCGCLFWGCFCLRSDNWQSFFGNTWCFFTKQRRPDEVLIWTPSQWGNILSLRVKCWKRLKLTSRTISDEAAMAPPDVSFRDVGLQELVATKEVRERTINGTVTSTWVAMW